jgi:hypothetical protein
MTIKEIIDEIKKIESQISISEKTEKRLRELKKLLDLHDQSL